MVGSINITFVTIYNKDIQEDIQTLKNIEKYYNINIVNGDKFYSIKRFVNYPIIDKSIFILDPIFFHIMPLGEMNDFSLKINWDRVISIEKLNEKEISEDKIKIINQMIHIVSKKMQHDEIVAKNFNKSIYSLYGDAEKKREDDFNRVNGETFYQ